ncbi:MAG: ribulose-phosphate 3-epimerase [Clostridiaceae bacterium]|jgi:ribulose-phosphate 3-epimerase|nr:ribulose-phosphate 3-epimerase [Clostridiaceae bacterium]
MNVLINPSILSANFNNLQSDLKLLEESGIKSIHIDVMDGNFVPNITFGPGQIKQLRKFTKMNFDVHLMVHEPIRFIKEFIDAGADSITVHCEACKHIYRALEEIKKNVQVGVALNPATSLSNIEYLTNIVDKILIMTVNPGFGGQKYINGMEAKIIQLNNLIKEKASSAIIQVDGGIGENNIDRLIELGAKDIVMGSSVFKNGNITENLQKFKTYI